MPVNVAFGPRQVQQKDLPANLRGLSEARAASLGAVREESLAFSGRAAAGPLPEVGRYSKVGWERGDDLAGLGHLAAGVAHDADLAAHDGGPPAAGARGAPEGSLRAANAQANAIAQANGPHGGHSHGGARGTGSHGRRRHSHAPSLFRVENRS